ncbi:MAG TPA: hypothetical protein VNH65_09345 [Candidatus Acidoferrum sp.]|nr:hypothetical protein [Candidatus Acidoferrum sp.]
MNREWKLRMQKTGGTIAAVAMSLGIAGMAPGSRLHPQDGKDAPTITVNGKFYCNIKALSPSERARHKVLTEKLLAARNETIETEKGYEFQYSPDKVSIAEVGEWVVAESKCCPFFDFHIDLEKQGTVVCLRLTGIEGIKAFIRSEFHI